MEKIQMAAMPSEHNVPPPASVDAAIAVPKAAKTKIAAATAIITVSKIDHVFVCPSGTFKMSAG
jgi:hypothetical protein